MVAGSSPTNSKIPTFMLRLVPAQIVALEVRPDLLFEEISQAEKKCNFSLARNILWFLSDGHLSQQIIRPKRFLSVVRLGDSDFDLFWEPSHSHQRVGEAGEVA